MYVFSPYVQKILNKYRTHLELVDTVPIGFTGAASEKPAPCFTSPVDTDALYFAINVNFTNQNVLVRIESISPNYQWMANQDPTPQDTPIGAIAGLSTQALPVLPLIQPFFIKAQGRIKMRFTNAASSPVTGGIITWRALKLVDPIDGGWDYSQGMV